MPGVRLSVETAEAEISRMRKMHACMSLATAVLGLVAAQSSATRAETWTMLVPGQTGSLGAEPPVSLALKDLAGGPALEVVTAPELDAIRQFKSRLRKGEASIAEIPLSVLARESALYAADQIPYLATTTAEAERLFERLAPMVAQRLSEDDLVLLALLPLPARGLMTNQAVTAASGLGGQTMWAPTVALRRLAEHLGATSVAERPAASVLFLTPAEALAHMPGTSAASLAGGSSGWTYHALGGWHEGRAVVVSAASLKSLGPDAGQAFINQARNVERVYWNAHDAGSKSSAASLAESGHKVVTGTSELAAELSKIGQRMADEWLPGAGADGAAWLEAVRASKPTTRP